MATNDGHFLSNSGSERKHSVASVESIHRDRDGEWIAYTFGDSCGASWVSDWDLSDDDILAVLRSIRARHLRLAEEYRIALQRFYRKGR
jgi:hypothetical protein